MKFDHRFTPKSRVELRQVKAIELASTILEDVLDLKDLGLTLQAQRQTGWSGSKAYHSGMYSNSQKLIKINFRNLVGCSLSTILQVLSHEFRHAYQYKNGLLVNHHQWKGPSLSESIQTSNKRYAKYFSQPWEIDARMYEKPYLEKIISDTRFSKFVEYLNEYSGEKLKKLDYDATHALIPYDRQGVEFFKFRREPNVRYWMHTSQIPGCKKWTRKFVDKAFTEFKSLLLSQKVQEIYVEVDIDDLVS
jgi:hypothetical protein